MKKLSYILSFISMLALLLYACKKEETKTFMKAGVPPALTASQPNVVLSAANAADTVEAFSWSASDYGYPAAVTYTLQIAKGGTNFAAPQEISMGNGKSRKYAGADLNQLALILGLAPGNVGQLEVRVRSSISDSIPAIYSNKIIVNVTPYLVIINYPSLWVPGDYQGWDPATAPKISSKLANGIYEGYVNIPGGTRAFKYTSHPDWNHTNYGWASSTVTGNNVTGTFNTTGGDLFVPTAGYHLLKANTNNNTWSGTKITSWSLIGDFNAWGGDVDMVYNTTTLEWTATINPASAGGFKFRANHDWPINFGDTGADLSLEYDGANIPITPGSHLITLKLGVPGNYTYTIQ
jgi:starch-binding outer membrane protein SusE/F